MSDEMVKVSRAKIDQVIETMKSQLFRSGEFIACQKGVVLLCACGACTDSRAINVISSLKKLLDNAAEDCQEEGLNAGEQDAPA